MTGQWEQYVAAAAVPLDPDAFDVTDPQHDHWAMDLRREVAQERARKVLAIAGPLIAEDTRTRMVEAAGKIVEREQAASRRMSAPEQADVDALRDLLDLMENFPSNDQRARYLLSCDWMRDRGAQAAARIRAATR